VTEEQGSVIPFQKFQEVLAEELMLPKEKLKPDASLVKDLQVDSLALASMMLRMEEMGVYIPVESAWEIETVDDVYQAYVQYAGAQDVPMKQIRTASSH
jgi:acyl carrier protein